MRLLVTAGPTREYFDSVRFISNASTGKMGFAIASAAVAQGHRVTLISGPVSLDFPTGVHGVRVVSAAEMFDAAVREFESCDAAVMAAAVSDFRPKHCGPNKLPKNDCALTVELEATRDICAHLGSMKGSRVVVGFAMEDHEHKAHAEEKLHRKGCDAIVMNDLANLASNEAAIQVFRGDIGWQKSITGTKLQVAESIILLVEELTARR